MSMRPRAESRSVPCVGRATTQGWGYADWEFSGEDHRDRLERLFGTDMPAIWYARCDRALVYEADRLRRIVAENDISYVIYDSVAFACDGPPESAGPRYERRLMILVLGVVTQATPKPFSNIPSSCSLVHFGGLHCTPQNR